MSWEAYGFRGVGHSLTLEQAREIAAGESMISPLAAAALPVAIEKDWFVVKVLGIMLVPKDKDGRPIVDDPPPSGGQWVPIFDIKAQVKVAAP
jgi:hypothetical protein